MVQLVLVIPALQQDQPPLWALTVQAVPSLLSVQWVQVTHALPEIPVHLGRRVRLWALLFQLVPEVQLILPLP